jgi:hypothetical protein
MRVTSNRELARQIGVSETAVRRAEKAGRIRREPDGSWDAAKVKAAWSDNTDQAQQRPARSGGRTGKHRTLKPVPEAALGAVRDTLREHGEPIVAGAMTFMQARTANEVLKAQEPGGGHSGAAGPRAAMIPVPAGVRVWLASGVTDMRKGMNGLSLLVQEGLGRDPHAGDLFVFRGRRGDCTT